MSFSRDCTACRGCNNLSPSLSPNITDSLERHIRIQDHLSHSPEADLDCPIVVRTLN